MDCNLSLERLAAALSLEYECVFFVDVETDHYAMYAFQGEHKNLELTFNNDFWGDTCKNLQVVYEEDKKRFAEAINKDFLLNELKKNKSFVLNYRLMMNSEPVWYSLKAVMGVNEGNRFIVIGTSNIDQRVREEERLRKQADRGDVYEKIVMALAERHDSIYLLDLETDHYVQYKSVRTYNELSVSTEGDHFFEQLQQDALRVIYKEDLPFVMSALRKDLLIKELDDNGAFSMKYRLVMPSGPTYVNLDAVYSDKSHIIISVTNIDAQVRRENEIKKALGIAIEKSRRDDLTGIRNKNAYGEFEADFDQQIRKGECREFAIALCDLNGLKQVNDTLGHKAGDEYIKEASKLMCETFRHSPVFRIGGDEFVAILRGGDYERRASLEQSLDSVAFKNYREGKVSFACGISVFEEGDSCSADVFKRADKLMYEKKVRIKQD